jgi:NADPH:quinone reductase-like Zn-dependent oxidoreductase
VRLATNVKKGQVVLVTGALGSVGRAAVHTAKKIGAQVIAGVRGKELDDVRSLGVPDVLAVDDDKAIEKFRLVDAIADTVGGDVAAKLIAKVKQSGSFGYTAVLPESAAAKNPTVKISRVLAQSDPSKVREFADDVRDGKFILPIGRRMPLRDAAEAHALGVLRWKSKRNASLKRNREQCCARWPCRKRGQTAKSSELNWDIFGT